MTEELALPKAAQDVNCLDEHLRPILVDWPVVPEDVLIEILPASDPEEEAAFEEVGRRRCGLGDHGRVDADHGARHARTDLELRGFPRDPSENGPHEW